MTFKIAILRYFNPVGAHESGTIGEDPNGIFICIWRWYRSKRLYTCSGFSKCTCKSYRLSKLTNIGTGFGSSVLEMIKASNKKIPYKIVNRRAGDIAKCYADPSYAKEILGWEAIKTLDEDSWRWQSNNPNGYK